MRSGSDRPAPGVVTRTGRIACTPWPGCELEREEVEALLTYAAMIGCDVRGME